MHRSRMHVAGSTDPAEDISLIRTMIYDLQEEKENLKHSNQAVLDEVYQKQKSLDELRQQVRTYECFQRCSLLTYTVSEKSSSLKWSKKRKN